METFQHRMHIIVGVFSLLLSGVSGASWSYSGTTGPSHWSSIDSKCGGSKQSPINIATFSTTLNYLLAAITFTNFDSTTGIALATMENNGHTVTISLPSSNYMISGGGLEQSYKLAQFHFHWGADDTTGSEHTVDGKHYPMEVHFVTYASKYANVSTALPYSDGLAVLGFFFEISSSTNTAWDTIVNQLQQVLYNGANTTAPSNLMLSSLLPGNRNVYYRYQGSLTTPNCDEVVTWTVFKETIKISSAQMAKFRAVFSNNQGAMNTSLSGNYRPVQSLGIRTVYYNSAHALSAASGLLCASLLWTMMCLIKS